MTQNASQNDLKCNTKPVAGCLRSDWAIVPRQIDVSARSVAFVTGKPLCIGRNSAFQLCGERIRCPGTSRKNALRRPRTCVHGGRKTRHLAESRVYRVRSRSSPIFEKSVCDMAGRCTWSLFCGWTRSVRRETARRTGKLIRSNWFLHPLRDLWDFSLVGESWLKIPVGESYDAGCGVEKLSFKDG